MVAYVGGTKEEIQQLIAEWEDGINRFAKVGTMDMEGWKVLVPHPGHTRNRETQYK